MKITEVRVKIMQDRGDKLQAFCTITLDDAFVIRDLKIIEGSRGVFVAMPSRKLTDRCPKCGSKNHLRAGYCNDCGARQVGDRAVRDEQGRAKLHADVAHPINSATREAVQRVVLEAYRSEIERSKQPGYVPPKLYDEEDFVDDFDDRTPARGIAMPKLGSAPDGRGPAPDGRVPTSPPRGIARPAAAAPPPAPPAAKAASGKAKAEGAADDFSSGILG